MPWVSDSSVTYWLNLLPDLQSYFITLCISGNILWVSACVSLKRQYLLLKWDSQMHILQIISYLLCKSACFFKDYCLFDLNICDKSKIVWSKCCTIKIIKGYIRKLGKKHIKWWWGNIFFYIPFNFAETYYYKSQKYLNVCIVGVLLDD